MHALLDTANPAIQVVKPYTENYYTTKTKGLLYQLQLSQFQFQYQTVSIQVH